jgi:hypothetical protein
MRITATIPDHGDLVTAVMEGFVQAAQLEIEAGVVPPSPLMMPNLKFIDEPPGKEDWLLPHQVVQAGGGDCEDYAFWTAAGLRATGSDPGAHCVLMQTGPDRLHCVVQTSDGGVIDPSTDIKRRHPLRRPKVGDNLVVKDHRSDAIRKQAAQEHPDSLDAWMYKQGTRTFDSRKDVPVKPGVEYGKNVQDFLSAHGVKLDTLEDLIGRGVVNPEKMVAYQQKYGTYGGKDYAKFGRPTQTLSYDDTTGMYVDTKTGNQVDPSEVPGNNLDLLTMMEQGFDPSMFGPDGMFGGIPPDYAWGYPEYTPYGGFGMFGGFGVYPPGMADLDEVVDPGVFWSNAATALGLPSGEVIDAEAQEVDGVD